MILWENLKIIYESTAIMLTSSLLPLYSAVENAFIKQLLNIEQKNDEYDPFHSLASTQLIFLTDAPGGFPP